MAGSVSQRWTKEDVAKLRSLCSLNTLFMKEIAEKLGRPAASVGFKARQLGITSKPPGRFAEWNRKHAHLREQVMKYYLTHSFSETAKHFGLPENQLKSCITNGYKDPELQHLRKEWRPHTAWTTKDWLFMIQHAGVQPREWIGRKLKRGGTFHSVKDALAKFKGYAKYMNGMPLQWSLSIFGEEARGYAIQTKSGPFSEHGDFRYRIIPWVTCERLLDRKQTRRLLGKGKCKPERKQAAPRLEIDEEVVAAVRAMAHFQRWIFGSKSERVIVQRIKQSLRRRK